MNSVKEFKLSMILDKAGGFPEEYRGNTSIYVQTYDFK